MSSIKLKNSKVILKNNKVSCTCCNCNEIFSITDQNVFEITELEYNKYRNGGEWNINGNWSVNELVPSQTPICTGIGNDVILHSQNSSGCSHNINFQTSASVVYTGPCSGDTTVDYSFNTNLNVLLSYQNNKFYAKYIMNSNVSSSELTSSPTGYPATVNFSVDGNTLVAFGSWGPSWRSYAGYINTSSMTISATFTQNT
jgi:hypothetical protein